MLTEGIDTNLVDALAVLALKEICSYIDLDGNPVICDWEAYQEMCDMELNKFRLTKEQFNIIKGYLETKFKGKL